MAIISIKNLKPGMVLVADAEQANGRLLLKSGSKLTENNIKIFKTWGVLSAAVQSEEEQLISSQKKYSADEIKKTISNKQVLFQHSDLKHPLVNALFRSSVKMSLEQEEESP